MNDLLALREQIWCDDVMVLFLVTIKSSCPIFCLYPPRAKRFSFGLISRVPAWHVIVAVIVHVTSMRITLETVSLLKIAPVCTVEKCSEQDSMSRPTAKPGNMCINAAFLVVYPKS